MSRKSLTAAALVLTLAGGATLPRLCADHYARAAVGQALAGMPAVSVGAVDIADGGVVLRGIGFDAGGTQVRIGAMRLPTVRPAPFAFLGEAWAQAPSGTASASDIAIVHGATTYTIKKLDLSGTSLSSADLAALLDPKRPESASDRLRRIDAGAITVSDLTADTAAGNGASTRASLAQVTLSDVHGGKVATLAATGAQVIDTKAPTPPTLKTGAIQAKGVDLLAAIHLSEATRSDDSEPLQRIADTIAVGDIVATNKDNQGTLAIGTFTGNDLRARPLRTGLEALGGTASTGPGTDSAGLHGRRRAALDDLAGSYEFGAIAIAKLAFAAIEKGAPVKLDLAGLDLRNYRGRTLEGFAVRDVRLEQPSTALAFATLDLGGIRIPSGGDAGPTIVKADMTQASVDVATQREDGTASRFRFKVAHVATAGEQGMSRLPIQGTLNVDHLTFDLPAAGEAGARELRAMGYSAMDLTAAIASTYDEQRQTLTLGKLMLGGIDMGTIDIAADLANVGRGIVSPSAAVAKASALAILVKRLDLRLTDAGLVNRALAWRAREDGKGVEDERAAAVDLFGTKLPLLLGDGANARAIGAAVARFVAEPKSLHVSAASKDGLGVADMGLLGSPDVLLGRLDIQAEANR